MKSNSLRYSYNVLGLAIIVFLFLRQGTTALFMYIGADKNINIWILASIVIIFISCIVPIILTENLSGIHPKLFNRVKWLPSLTLVGYGYLLITLVSIINTLMLSALEQWGVSFTPQVLHKIEGPVTFILYFISVCVLPPILEEIFLRGFVLNVLAPYGKLFAIIASAICFAVMHIQVQNLIPIFFCGIILGCIYYLTQSIWVCIVLHFVNNTISFIMMYFSQSMNAVSALAVGAYLNLFIVIIGLLSRQYLHKINFRISHMLKKDKNTSKKVLTIFKSPVALLAVITILAMTIEQFFKEIIR